jgi:hypothetical protein
VAALRHKVDDEVAVAAEGVNVKKCLWDVDVYVRQTEVMIALVEDLREKLKRSAAHSGGGEATPELREAINTAKLASTSLGRLALPNPGKISDLQASIDALDLSIKKAISDLDVAMRHLESASLSSAVTREIDAVLGGVVAAVKEYAESLKVLQRDVYERPVRRQLALGVLELLEVDQKADGSLRLLRILKERR